MSYSWPIYLLQPGTLATLTPGGGFEITSYKYLIKFLAKGHSSPKSLYREETVIFFFQLQELFKKEQVSVILIAVERSSRVRI